MKGMEKSGEGSEGDSDISDAIAAQVLYSFLFSIGFWNIGEKWY